MIIKREVVVSLACEKQADFYINKPVFEVFGYLSKLPEIASFKTDFVDPKSFKIHLSRGVSFNSWGEDIVLSFFDPMNGGTMMRVESKPKFPLTLVDYGVNKKNVESIGQWITSMYRGC